LWVMTQQGKQRYVDKNDWKVYKKKKKKNPLSCDVK
jgi:hypothetical protein